MINKILIISNNAITTILKYGDVVSAVIKEIRNVI